MLVRPLYRPLVVRAGARVAFVRLGVWCRLVGGSGVRAALALEWFASRPFVRLVRWLTVAFARHVAQPFVL